MNWKRLYSLIRQYKNDKMTRERFVLDWKYEQERMKAAFGLPDVQERNNYLGLDRSERFFVSNDTPFHLFSSRCFTAPAVRFRTARKGSAYSLVHKSAGRPERRPIFGV